MCLFKCKLKDASHLQIETNDSIFFVKGDFYYGEFHPYPEELARVGIDEKEFFDYVKEQPECSNVKLNH